MIEVSVDELKKNLLKYLEQSQNEDIVITNQGEKIAVVMSPKRYVTLNKVNRKERFENLAGAMASIEGVNFDWELLKREVWESKELFE